MRRIAVLLVLLAAFAAGFSDGGDSAKAAPLSNYGGWESGTGVFCGPAANGLVVYMPERYTCGFAYDPGVGLYYPAWGFVASCRTSAPYYGYCWRWNT